MSLLCLAFIFHLNCIFASLLMIYFFSMQVIGQYGRGWQGITVFFGSWAEEDEECSSDHLSVRRPG
jgi:hypothetical protein